jgi:hypothetical protein
VRSYHRTMVVSVLVQTAFFTHHAAHIPDSASAHSVRSQLVRASRMPLVRVANRLSERDVFHYDTAMKINF